MTCITYLLICSIYLINIITRVTIPYLSMKNIAASTLVLLFICLFARAAVHDSSYTYTEDGYFTVAIPIGWNKIESSFGLSQAEKKVFGAEFWGPQDNSGITSIISIHYYAPDNLLHKTAEKFIATHSMPVLKTAPDEKTYGAIRIEQIHQCSTSVFDRQTFTFIPPHSMKQKKIPIYEKFYVLPVQNGFYVLKFYSSMSTTEKGLADFDNVLYSFKMQIH